MDIQNATGHEDWTFSPKIVAWKGLENFGRFFYIVNPRDTTYKHYKDIPDLLGESIPLYAILVILEWILFTVKGWRGWKMSEAFSSAANGLLTTSVKFVAMMLGAFVFENIYTYRFVHFDWSATSTWLTAAIGYEFFYYWTHRLMHETNIGWASHQVHHSSQDFNLATAFRQSVIQPLFIVVNAAPLALLGIPTAAILTHLELNTVAQFWIHNSAIGKLGPIEWILNTPSHHRVHHGSNPWCVDKNYGGFTIVFDRLFGTFAEERNDEEIAYGLIDPPASLNPLYLQFFYFKNVFQTMFTMEKWQDKLKVLFYGPGWSPGADRLMTIKDLPEVSANRPQHGSSLSGYFDTYAIVHLLIAAAVNDELTNLKEMSFFATTIHLIFIWISVISIGGLYDDKPWARRLEIIRCAGLALWCGRKSILLSLSPSFNVIFVAIYASSALFWILRELFVYKVKQI